MKKVLFGLTAILLAAMVFTSCTDAATGAAGAGGKDGVGVPGDTILSGNVSEAAARYALASGKPVVFAGATVTSDGAAATSGNKISSALVIDKAVTLIANSPALTVNGIVAIKIAPTSAGKGTISADAIIGPKAVLAAVAAPGTPQIDTSLTGDGKIDTTGANIAVMGNVTISDDPTSATNIKADELGSKGLYIIGNLAVNVTAAFGGATTVTGDITQAKDTTLTVTGSLTVPATSTVYANGTWAGTVARAPGSKFIYSSTTGDGQTGGYMGGTTPTWTLGEGAFLTQIAGGSGEGIARKGWTEEISGGTATLKKGAYYLGEGDVSTLTVKTGGTLVVDITETTKKLALTYYNDESHRKTPGVLTVENGATLTVAAGNTIDTMEGTTLTIAANANLNVDGTLALNDTTTGTTGGNSGTITVGATGTITEKFAGESSWYWRTAAAKVVVNGGATWTVTIGGQGSPISKVGSSGLISLVTGSVLTLTGGLNQNANDYVLVGNASVNASVGGGYFQIRSFIVGNGTTATVVTLTNGDVIGGVGPYTFSNGEPSGLTGSAPGIIFKPNSSVTFNTGTNNFYASSDAQTAAAPDNTSGTADVVYRWSTNKWVVGTR
jgi:hypothetical protein